MTKKQIWNKTLAQIEVKLDSPAHFKTWFKDTRLIKIEGKDAVVGVKNTYAADWLYQRHKGLIKKTLSYVYGKPINPKFIYDKKSAKKFEKKSPPDKDEPILKVKDGIDEISHQKIQGSNLNERYTFSNFVVGSSNKLAHAAAVSVSKTPGKSYNPLFIYGPTGVGKTHILQAIGRFILDSDSKKNVLYCTAENFLNDLIESLRANKMEYFRSKYRKLDALIIDDIQLVSRAKQTQDEFFNTFNVLFQASKLLVIASDRPPEEIPTVQQRLISRFQGGMVADMARPDYEERVAILVQKIADNGFNIPDKTIKFLAEIIKDNVRELEGALQKISLYSTMKKEGELSLAEIAKILGKDPQSKRKQVRLSTVFKKISKEFGVSVKDIKGPRRTKDVAMARQVCMYILRNEFGYKLHEVSNLLKRKDHTTAIHAIDKVQSMMQSNLTISEQINNLIAEIQKPIEE